VSSGVSNPPHSTAMDFISSLGVESNIIHFLKGLLQFYSQERTTLIRVHASILMSSHRLQ
jgi:hypothetical protein